ncbi:MAG: DUF3572 domain-containing protein [Kordiimonadaceae bacterium]|jgi:hypothetical protein|nr:DUF3572 domain-containing protein [Kordiimonadaceae bacterium]
MSLIFVTIMKLHNIVLVNVSIVLNIGYEKAVNFFICLIYVIINTIPLSRYTSVPNSYNKEEISMDYDRAEIIAINSLSFIAGEEKYLERYLNLSGIGLDQLKENISNPELMPNILASVIDFLLQNENCLVEFSENYQLDPSEIQKTRSFFPGAMPEQ